jgi:hypothetical protein
MSTWISRALTAAALLALAACDLASFGGTTKVALFDGTMTLAAPSGYCIDPAAVHQAGDAVVAVLGRCAATSTATPGLLTVSVGQPGSAGVMTAGGAALAAFFTSTEGRRVLSRSGKAQDVQVRQAVGRPDAFVMRVTDRAVGDYWRAVTGIGGRLVTISATGAEGAPLAPEAGRALVDAAVAAMRAANPGAMPPIAP